MTPTGVQEVTMSVRPSVRPFGGMLFKALNFHHSNNQLHAIFKQSVRNESSLSEHSVSTQRALRASKKESIQSEPKILRLVSAIVISIQQSKNYLQSLSEH